MKIVLNDEQKKHVGLWVEELRSTKNNQAKGGLRIISPDGDGYCCLGIACLVYARQTGKGTWIPSGTRYEFRAEPSDKYSSCSVLPHSVAEWFGFPDGNPMMLRGPDGGGFTPAFLNDAFGFSFRQIADEVERALLMEGSNG